MKIWRLFILLTTIFAGTIYAGGLSDINHIPDLEVQIKLPPELIGEFEFPLWNEMKGEGGHIYYVIEIHENNKFLWRRTSPDFLSSDQGYVIEEVTRPGLKLSYKGTKDERNGTVQRGV
jgi:hypothetical protein